MAAIPEYAVGLEETDGRCASTKLQATVDEQLPAFRRNAEMLYRNYVRIIEPALTVKGRSCLTRTRQIRC